MKYRAKKAEVDAFRFDADAEITGPEWFGQLVEEEKAYIYRSINDGVQHIYGCEVYTSSGKIIGKIGDYIVRMASGEVIILKPDQFEARYESVGV